MAEKIGNKKEEKSKAKISLISQDTAFLSQECLVKCSANQTD
jgi:ABC-type uncharacterized transport system substrate-binding protein